MLDLLVVAEGIPGMRAIENALLACIRRGHGAGQSERRGRRARFDVTIHAPHATRLYTADGGPIGGAEVQTMRMAKAMADGGLRVCHVVLDAPGLPFEAEGVRIIGQRLPGSTPLHTVAYCLRALMRADSRVYIQRSAGWETGMVGLVARLRGRPFVFSSSCDIDFSGNYLQGTRERILFWLGARLASVAVVQNRGQLRLAEENDRAFTRTEVIRSFAPEPTILRSDERRYFLWIGRLDALKRPLEFLELAAALPQASFRMVLTAPAHAPRALADAIAQRAAQLSNVELLTPRPRDELLQLYAEALALVSTSQADGEGFPNVFLEAWAAGTPVLSLVVDPDGVITTHGLGFAAGGSMPQLVEAARALWSERNPEPYEAATHHYLSRFHSPQAVGAQWTQLVRSLIES